jgi:hypothetical protein
MNKHLPFFSRCSMILLALIFLVTAARSESSFEKTLKSFTANEVKGYIQPLADVFGANMNAGWYRSAELPRTGFNISFNIIGMAAKIGTDQQVYTANAPAGYNPATFETATVFGKQGKTVTDVNTGLSYRGSDGALDVSLFPLATLQVTIGHLYGTELIIRGIPLPEISGAPKITFWGVGGRHSISQYLFSGDDAPVHIAAGVFYNRISLGDFVTVSAFSAGPQVSKKFSVLELYGALAYESNSMNIKFTSTATGSPTVDIELPGENNFHGTIGAALNLGFLHLHADANFGSLTSFSTGIGFGF